MKRLILILSVPFVLHNPAGGRTIKVVTTLNYLKYVTEQVAGDRASVRALANPKQDPHYVTPTPGMNELAHDADLFIENGLSLDLWAQNVIDASGNPAIQRGTSGHLVATVNVPVKELPMEASRAWGDIHPQGNPHVWLDPLNVKIIAGNIVGRLSALDPDGAGSYRERLEEFNHRLDIALFGEDLMKLVGSKAGDILTRKARNNELDAWLAARRLESRLGGWLAKARPVRGLKIISYHKTYTYFADRFGIRILAELEEKPGIPPPPKYRDAIVELAKRESVTVVLNDNFYSRDAADYVAHKTQARVLVSYIEVGAAPETNSYEKLITYLIEEMLHATS